MRGLSRAGISRRVGKSLRLPKEQGKERLAFPSRLLEDDAIAVRVLERDALAVPIGIEGGNGIEACIPHSLDGGLPFVGVWKIEDEKILRSRRAARHMSARPGELQVVGHAFVSEDDPVKAIVAMETLEEVKAQTLPVELK